MKRLKRGHNNVSQMLNSRGKVVLVKRALLGFSLFIKRTHSSCMNGSWSPLAALLRLLASPTGTGSMKGAGGFWSGLRGGGDGERWLLSCLIFVGDVISCRTDTGFVLVT